jgi:lipid-A-disaccharide synthase
MWRSKRIHQIKRAVSKILTLFPFETALYDEAGVVVEFVGHPLSDLLERTPQREEARSQLKLPSALPVVAMLPGSRVSEVSQMAELFIQTARAIRQSLPQAQFLVPLASRETRDLFERALYRNQGLDLDLTVLFGHAHEAMSAADIVLVASGTATLEAALLKKPMVITYKMPAASYWLLKGKGRLPYYGLPNILCGEFVVPEILQNDATPLNLSQALLNLLDDEEVRRRLERRFGLLRSSLRGGGAKRAALAVLPLVTP